MTKKLTCVIILLVLVSCSRVTPIPVPNATSSGSFSDEVLDSQSKKSGLSKTPEATDLKKNTVTITVAPTRTPIPKNLGADIPSRKLDKVGPWLVASSRFEVWIFNADGSGATQMFDGVSTRNYISEQNFAVLYGRNWTYEDMPQLYIFSIPEGKLEKQIQLLPLIPGNIHDDPLVDRASSFAAAAYSGAWSHDGKHFAFSAAIDGPTTDLYIYTLGSDKLRRMSSGPKDVVLIEWSPNDKYIVYGGAGEVNLEFWELYNYDVDFWAVRVRDGKTTKLQEGIGYAYSMVVDWVSDSQVITFTDDREKDYEDVRVVDLESGENKILWCGNYYDLGYNSEYKKLYLVAPEPESTTQCSQPAYSGGAKWISVPDGRVTRISLYDEYDFGGWIKSRGIAYFGRHDSNDFIGLSPSGETIPLRFVYMDNPSLAVFAPNGVDYVLDWDYLPIFYDGKRFDMLKGYYRSYSGGHPVWNPSGDAIFFSGVTYKYAGPKLLLLIARAPDFHPSVLLEPISGDKLSFYWIK